jgi:PAT family beta-lactamase induction signal transducer AmpG
VVSFEYFGVGLGGAALVAYQARLASRALAASQLALLTSVTTIPRVLAGSGSGMLVEAVGYSSFFLLCAAAAVPGMLLLARVAPWHEPRPDTAAR